MIINIVKDWFIRFEGLRRSITVLVGSEREINIDLACLRKKVLNTLSNFELKNNSCAFL